MVFALSITYFTCKKQYSMSLDNFFLKSFAAHRLRNTDILYVVTLKLIIQNNITTLNPFPGLVNNVQ